MWHPRIDAYLPTNEPLVIAVGVAFPLLKGRGIFNYDVGLLPRRHPIVTVIGAPITLPHISEPTEQQIDEAHTLYLEKLMELYNTHKEAYGQPNRRLVLV
jgi:2-acylglycerol O-acyltransferase 2